MAALGWHVAHQETFFVGKDSPVYTKFTKISEN